MIGEHGQGTFTLDGRIKRVSTYMCSHCNRHSHLKIGEAPYGTCKQCMGLICEECYGALHTGVGCKPLEQWLAEQEGAITRRVMVSTYLKEAGIRR